MVFVNDKKIESYKAEIQENDSLAINSLNIVEEISFKSSEEYPEILLFNKPI